MNRCFFLLLISLTSTTAFPGQVAIFHFVEKPGPYSVGLKVVHQYDYSRIFRESVDDLGKPYLEERARPLQTLIWYPAVPGGGKPMTVGDYVRLLATETSFDKPNSGDVFKGSLGLGPNTKSILWAVRDASQKAGSFPIVIYAPSLSSQSWENADLCEYLASHGYVVIASPSLGPTTRQMPFTIEGVNAQARDISFLIGYAASLPNTDTSKIAVMGFSWGGLSNFVAAARDDRIGALVSLDGSLRYFPGVVKRAGDVHPEQMTIPLMFIAKQEDVIEHWALGTELQEGPNVLNAWTHGDLIMVRMLALIHEQMSSMYQRSQEVWNRFPNSQNADYAFEDGIPGYGLIAKYTLMFLDAYLKHDAKGMEYLKKTPAENEIPKHFVVETFRAASDVAPSLVGFRNEVLKQGADHAADIYIKMRQQTPNFQLDEQALESWATSLASNAQLAEAIDILKVNAQMHPESGGAYYSLALAYEKAGKNMLAIENYKTCLKYWPTNPNLGNRIKMLSATNPAAN
jgi:pimeloyl-ACP methyl ester carboxylesterase